MPATRPANADPKPTRDEDMNFTDPAGPPFSLHYDKLVIAVGAYSQSDLVFSNLLFSFTQVFSQLTTYQGSKNMPIF